MTNTPDQRHHDWRAFAACADADPEQFHPVGGGSTYARAVAKLYCDHCPVAAQCLEFARATGATGIYAGTSTRERTHMTGHLTGTRRERADRNHRVCQLYTQGYSAAEIAEKVGITTRTVQRIRQANEITGHRYERKEHAA